MEVSLVSQLQLVVGDWSTDTLTLVNMSEHKNAL